MKKRFDGHHRNAALAEKHRARLEKKLGMEVVISARRNSAGAFSSRGRHFVFTAIPPEEKDFENLTLAEYERYMNAYGGDTEEREIETSGDYGDEE